MTELYTWMAYESAHARPAPAAPVAPIPRAITATLHTGPVTAPLHAPTPLAPAAPVAPTQPAGSSVSGGVWAGLRQCESGGNYADNTGNGYYGAYQFSLATWHGLGFPGCRRTPRPPCRTKPPSNSRPAAAGASGPRAPVDFGSSEPARALC